MPSTSRKNATHPTQSAPGQKKKKKRKKKGLAKFLDFDDENEINENDDSNIDIDENKAEKGWNIYLESRL